MTDNIEIIEFINKWNKTHSQKANFHLFKILKERYETEISNFCNFETDNFSQKVWHFINNKPDIPKCEICKEEFLNFRIFSNGYPSTCSSSCSTKLIWKNYSDTDIKKRNKKISKSHLENFKNEEIKEEILNKRKTTNLEKYGAAHFLKTKEGKQKYNNVIFEKYGVDNIMKLQKHRNRVGKQFLELNQNKEWKENRIQKYNETIKERYNVNNVFQIPEIRKRIIENNQKKYGCNWFFENKENQKYLIERVREKYGVDNVMELEEFKRKGFINSVTLKEKVINNKTYLFQSKDEGTTLDIIATRYKNIKSQFECPKFKYFYDNKQYSYRPDFYIEEENKIIEVKSIYHFFNDYETIFEKNQSVLNAGYNLEFWLYNHQKDYFIFDFKDDFINKLEYNKNKCLYGNGGILDPINKLFIIRQDTNLTNIQEYKRRLLLKNNDLKNVVYLFEDYLNDKLDIVKSRINNILNKTKHRIYARQTTIRQINYKQANEFLNKNHIQGVVSSKYYLGAFIGEELVSVMTFSKPRVFMKSKDDFYEISRFCSKLDTSVIGIASKFIKYFKTNLSNKKIISFADYNWSNGKLYEKLNFKNEGLTSRNYYYVKSTERFHRFSFRKNILVEKYGYDKNLTELEITQEMGLERLYDCGSIKFSL